MISRSREVMKFIARNLLIMLATLSFFPSLSYGDWKQFIPQPVANQAVLELYGSYESAKNSTPTSTVETKDTFLSEKLTLTSFGYSYHPRFIQYFLSLSGALNQENFESTTSSTGWRNASGYEYDAQILVLPKHPYNLKLFARRYEPIGEMRSASVINLHQVEYSKGAIFQYDERPYSLHAGYTDSSSETSFGHTDVEHLSVRGLYYKMFKNYKSLAVSAGYDQVDFGTSQSSNKGTLRSYDFGNTIGVRWGSLSSSFVKSDGDQRTALPGKVTNSFLTWNEALTAYLPLNFTVNADYLYQKSELTSEATETAPERNVSNTQRRTQFQIIHQLYNSLRSSYTFLNVSYESSGGEIDNTTHLLQADYKKRIPWGRLSMGAGLGRSVSDNTGQTAFANEPHNSDVPGSFVLNLDNPDRATIVVYMKSPEPPFELVLLEENVHYVVVPFANTFQINIFTVPPPFVVPGRYDFLVSYSLVSGSFKYRTDTINYNANVSLFDDRVNPYYAFSKFDQKVISGAMQVVPVDSTSHTIGLTLQSGPYSATGEYQRVDSTVSPYRRWMAQVTWHKEIVESTQFYVTGQYINTDYPEGQAALPGPAYNEQVASVVSNIAWRPRVHLYLAGSGSYLYRVTTLLKERAYSLGSSFYWQLGKLILSVNASVTSSDSETTTSVSTKNLHQLYFLKIVRTIR